MFRLSKRERACLQASAHRERTRGRRKAIHKPLETRFTDSPWRRISPTTTLVTRRNLTTTVTAFTPPPSKHQTPLQQPQHTTTFSAARLVSAPRLYPPASKTTAKSSPASTAPHAPPSPRFQSSISPSIKASPLTSGERASTTSKSSEASTVSIQLPRTMSSLSRGTRWLTEIPPTVLGKRRRPIRAFLASSEFESFLLFGS